MVHPCGHDIEAFLGSVFGAEREGEAVAKLVPFATPKKALRARAPFRAALRKAKTPSTTLIRKLRDEGY